MRTKALCTAITPLLLAGCAGAPLVDLRGPGFTAADSTTLPGATLAEARQLLLRVRGTYRDAMATQLNTTQMSSTGLVALGALVTGLAAGKAHPDAIVGASLIGGTAYAVGTLTLDRRRVLAFDAGIKALDCAQAAVIPLDLDATQLATLAAANKTLLAARASAAARAREVAATRDELVALAGIGAPQAAAVKTSLAQMDAALAEADSARKAADKLTRDTREVGQRLQNTVYAIAAKVDGVIAQTVPDVSAVQQVVGGLGGFAAGFAPGAGVDKSLAGALARYNSAGGATANAAIPTLKSVSDRLAVELKALDDAATALIAAASAVNDGLAAVDSAAVMAALKGCNVADVVLPLVLEPATLALEPKGGPGKGFAIRGGTKPYSVRALDGAVEGLSIAFGGGFGDSAQVSASDKVPADDYRLQVSDSAGNSRQLVVTVGAKAGGPPAPAGAGTTVTAGTGTPDAPSLGTLGTLGTLAKNVNGLQPFKIGTVSVTASNATPDAAGRLGVTVVCTPAQPTPKLAADVLAKRIFGDANKAGGFKGANPVVITPANPDCVQG